MIGLLRFALNGSLLFVLSSSALAEETTPMPSKEAIDVIWLATAAAMVFLMQAGFALLESGSSRAKNCINVAMKNYMDVCLGSLCFWVFGFGLMFGNNPTGFFGTSAFGVSIEGSTWDYSFILFQMMFAATAATIASGAMAERARFGSYLIIACVITGFIYPIFGSWAWGSAYEGSGWLAEKGFIDFAGSSVVHSVGGWCALAAIIVLGPRLGRFGPAGEVRDIPGHNLNYVAMGGFILWFGWFGFNGGSTVGANVNIGIINLNTQLAAAAGALGATLFSKLSGKPTVVSTIVNGSLSGLVGITAGCASMDPLFAVFTGFSAGGVYIAFNQFLLALRLDDVVGAVAVHGAAGAWGTLCAGIFFKDDMFNINIIVTQVIGIGSCFIWSFGSGMIFFYTIDKVIKLRSDSLHEQRGLDFTEHAEVSYPEFVRDSYYNKTNLEGMDR